MSTKPSRFILERFANLSFPRDDHGVSDYSHPAVVPIDKPTYCGPAGMWVPEMQDAWVFWEAPSWVDRRVVRVVPVTLTRLEKQ